MAVTKLPLTIFEREILIKMMIIFCDNLQLSIFLLGFPLWRIPSMRMSKFIATAMPPYLHRVFSKFVLEPLHVHPGWCTTQHAKCKNRKCQCAILLCANWRSRASWRLSWRLQNRKMTFQSFFVAFQSLVATFQSFPQLN